MRPLVSWLVAIVCLVGVSQIDADELPSYVGQPLTEVLIDLEARGLKILFTSQVVRPEMVVNTEPSADSLLGVLEEVLAANGLRAEPGPGETLVIVPAPPGETGVRGFVIDAESRQPVPYVQILIPGTAYDALSAEDGSFVITGIEPGSYSIEARRPGYVAEPLSEVGVLNGRMTEATFELVSTPIPLDEIVVTPSLISLLRADPVATLGLTSEEINALPHLGDDLFRALTLLPGLTASEFSAKFHVRGGRSDEVLVMLDQLELFDPYHIKDFSSALSIIAPYAIDRVELSLGGFPAPFGDRMAGVLDMKTVQPDSGRRQAGLSILSAQLGGSGIFNEERGSWLGVVRLGSLQLIEDWVSPEVQPRYGDAFVKVEHAVGKGHLGIRVLHADDRLNTFIEEDDEIESTDTSYGNTYLWVTHRALLGSKLYVDSVVSGGGIDQDRNAFQEEDGEIELAIGDRRDLKIAGIKQEWNYEASDRHYLRWGFDLRRLDTEYDYSSGDDIDALIGDIAGPRGEEDSILFRERFSGDQASLYVSDRRRLTDKITAELGLRYDEHSITDDTDLSPRFNLVAATGEATTLRFAWGHYFQSQRLYELLVEDGETQFFPSERTEQFALGLDHIFQGGSLRVDLYHRDITRPRPRYENLYEPDDSFPEVQADRVRIAPQRSRARGVEVFLRGQWQRLEWWINYAYARVEDEIDGRQVPRRFDQPHSFNASLAYQVNDDWTLNLAFRYHTGWPTTAFRGVLEPGDDGELEPTLAFGPLYGERLDDYHRLDLRVSRTWQLKKAELAFFLDIQNVYDRENLSGFDAELEFFEDENGDVVLGNNGQPIVTPAVETWGGLLPSLGIDLRF